MVRFASKKSKIVALSSALVLVASAAAYAYFTSTGQGSGSATGGSSSPFTVSSTADVAADLVPNTTIGTGVIDTVNYTVTNPSSGNEELANVVISIGNTTGTSPSTTETNWTHTVASNPACNSASYSVGAQSPGDGVTAGSGSYTVHPNVDLTPGQVYSGSVTLQMIDNSANQNSCQGATVPLYIAAS
jgi:hypothetical protein